MFFSFVFASHYSLHTVDPHEFIKTKYIEQEMKLTGTKDVPSLK